MSIRLEHVTKTFGRTTAVDDVSLDIRTGRVFAFLGPNGAGKTTTIKMMAGLLLPDHGRIEICGHPVSTDGFQAKSRMAYVPDQPFVYDKLTGREFLDFVVQIYNVPRDEASLRIDRYVELLRMGEFADQLAEGYSHGMKQRLVLAAALLHEPTVLVVDEPMVGLDPRTVRVVKDLFRERADAGHLVFMSTHTLEVAEALADEIAILHRGRIVAQGSLAQLRQQAARQQRLEDIFLQLTEEAELDRAAEAVHGMATPSETPDRPAPARTP
ncbi:MAG: ABC transporter ATP-binding protein [Phycisphaerae bacterium]|nr:ABC transporter ATP-binding protein [Phycisphaerae bacterium]